MVEPAYQVMTRTVVWWYQCRKISLRLRRTMNMVSNSSGICHTECYKPQGSIRQV